MSGQAWATYVPGEAPLADGSKPRGASLFARDFQTVVIYDSQGKFVGVRRPGSGLPIEVSSTIGLYCFIDLYYIVLTSTDLCHAVRHSVILSLHIDTTCLVSL